MHVHYQEKSAIIELPTETIIEGNIPKAKLKFVEACVEIHNDELVADWQLALGHL
ncbi:MAG: DUF4160 domain-containing protein [Gammaproteobacteria bacterium]|nr:DUF4160 domain-containing protein [Gammaproteobacteria bacterium]